MRRKFRYCLNRRQVKLSWHPRNCFNLSKFTPLNERNLSIFQIEWKSRAFCRLFFHGDVQEKFFRKAFNEHRRNFASTISELERRVDNTIFRCMFAPSIFEARRMASSGMILVNGKLVDRPGHILQNGDIIQVNPKFANRVHRLADHSFIRFWSFIPEYLEVNFPLLSAVFLHSPNFSDIPHPFPPYMIENTAAFYSKRC